MHGPVLAGNTLRSAAAARRGVSGAVDYADIDHANSIVGGGGYQTLGRGVLSSEGVQNRFGYAGYRYDHHLAGAERHLYHVRHRVYQAHIGRWATRDPLGYVDGMSVYEYVSASPLTLQDPFGLFGASCNGCAASMCASADPLPPLPPGTQYQGQWCGRDWLTAPIFATAQACSTYYFPRLNQLAGGPSGVGRGCRQRLQYDVSQCCSAYVGTANVCTFRSCLDSAQSRAQACNNTTNNDWWRRKDCFGQCETVEALWAWMCTACFGKWGDCAGEAGKAKVSCVEACGNKANDTGYHQAPIDMFNQMVDYLANCPLELIKDKLKDWLKDKLPIPDITLVSTTSSGSTSIAMD